MSKLQSKMRKDKFASVYFVDKNREHVNYVVTTDGRLMKINDNVEKLVGYKEELSKEKKRRHKRKQSDDIW